MKKYGFIQRQAGCLVLAALLCVPTLSGCGSGAGDSKNNTEAAPTEQLLQDAGAASTDLQELTLTDATPEELEALLSRMTQLQTVTLEGSLPETQTLLRLKEQYPQVEFLCHISLGGSLLSTGAKTLDLTDSPVTAEEFLPALPLFAGLEEVTLEDTWTDSEKMAFMDALPETFVRCTLPLAGQYFSTDCEEIDISGCQITVEEAEQMLPYFPKLQKLDMSYCGIPDEQMEEFNLRHPETSIVWTVTIGEVKMRTDAIYFYPAEINYYPTSAEMAKLCYCHDLIAVDIGHTRATDCEFLWHTPKVKYLILADTGITDITPVSNLKDLIYLELFNLRIDDYSPLLRCTKLQDLNIGTTHADPAPLSQMTWLHNLQWHRSDQNPETKEAVLKLPEQLPDTNVVLYPKKKARNIGGPWRYLPNYYVFRDIIGATYFNQDQIWDYWGQEDGDRIMACESGKSFCADTLAQIVRERIDSGEPIIGIKNVGSEKAEILYQTLLNAKS